MQHANYIPFGVKESRPCPAQNASLIWLKAVATVLLRHATFSSPVDHTRSLPDRGYCLAVPRKSPGHAGVLKPFVLAGMWLVELVLGSVRSVQQLVFGTYMLLDANRQHLAKSYFAQESVYS